MRRRVGKMLRRLRMYKKVDEEVEEFRFWGFVVEVGVNDGVGDEDGVVKGRRTAAAAAAAAEDDE